MTPRVFHYIGGAFIAGDDFLERRNPSDTDDVVALVPQGGAAEIAQAVTAARRAYPEWSGLTIEQRSDCLDRAGQALFARREEI